MKLDPSALFEASPNPYVLLDTAQNIVAANAAYLQVTMRRSDDLLGRALFDAFPSDPDSVAGRQLRQSLARVLDRGVPDHLPSIHYPIARPDGGTDDRYWSATHTPLRAPDGRVAYILQHTEDVTELELLRARSSTPVNTMAAQLMRRADAVAADNLALGAERDFLRQLFAQAPGFASVLRGPTHVFELVNPAQQALLGERPLLGLTVREALPELADQGFFELFDAVYASGEPYIGRGMVARLQREPGAPLEARQTDFVFQPVRDAAGRVQGIFVQGHDITVQEQARQAATRHATRFHNLSHAMPAQVWTAQPDGLLDWFNAQTEQYSGLPADALMGSGWVQMVHPDDLPLATAAWQQAMASGEPYHTEFRLRRHDGVYRWHIARALAVRDDGGAITQWVGTNTDIEDQKASAALLADLNNLLAQRVDERTAELTRMQETLRQSQKMEAIGNLAGGIAHDFNNLLQVIGGNLQLLDRTVAPQGEPQAHLQRAQNAVARGARLAAQLLAFGRRQPLAPEVLHIGRLIRGMGDLLRSTLGEAIEIDTVIAGGLWNTLVDPANVESALLNLAINARDAMTGQGKLTIEAGNAWLDDRYSHDHGDVTPGQYVMVAVSDTGAGMAADVLSRAFDPFFTTKPAGKGTGLGLSMVYGFVKQSGGHIKVYSEPGSGTTVRLYLPRSTQAEDRTPLPESPLPELGGETILVAEDDEAVRETTVALLRDLGYTVLMARDAQSALAIVDSGAAIDLLFTDVVMPGPLKSTELARKAQLRLPGLAVLFTSGYTDNAIVHGGRLDAGVQLLSKPYTRDALARKIDQCLRLARREGEAAPPAAAPAPGAPLRVLLCEDDALVRETVAELLTDLQCEVHAAATVAQARALLPQAQPHLLITDLILPDGDGASLAAWARQVQPALHLAIASGRGSAQAAAALPGAVALPKPFDIDDLAALVQRVRASG
jgi:PAS domain S-box-containing protein